MVAARGGVTLADVNAPNESIQPAGCGLVVRSANISPAGAGAAACAVTERFPKSKRSTAAGGASGLGCFGGGGFFFGLRVLGPGCAVSPSEEESLLDAFFFRFFFFFFGTA